MIEDKSVRFMSLTDSMCKSSDLTKEEQKLCYEFASDLHEIIGDLENKGYLRSNLNLKQDEKEKTNFLRVIGNVRNVTKAFNMFFDMYAERVKPDCRQRLKKFLELNKSYGMTENDLVYLLFSEMIFVYLQNIEEFRATFLTILELPIIYLVGKDRKTIRCRTELGKLLRSFRELGIKKIDALNVIDYELRNGLSHCLFWFDAKGDEHHSKPHLHYSKDMTFKEVSCISLADLYIKTRQQSIFTNCLLNVVADWFT